MKHGKSTDVMNRKVNRPEIVGYLFASTLNREEQLKHLFLVDKMKWQLNSCIVSTKNDVSSRQVNLKRLENDG
ncbi:unnamed protein product [Musa banksii]